MSHNKLRHVFISEKLKDDNNGPAVCPKMARHRTDGLFNPSQMGIDARDLLCAFHRDDYVNRPVIDVDDDQFHLCLQGANIAKAFKFWSETLKWPDGLTADYDAVQQSDWGISWLEVLVFLVNFFLCTGWRCPIKIGGAGAHARYIDYDDPQTQALLLPDAKPAASLQVLCMRNLLQNVSTILQTDVLPTFNSNKCYSMFRLGFKSPVAGTPCRPLLQNQELTMKYIWGYLQRLNGSI